MRDEKHDLSLVQFHDLNADAATALEQARPGHQMMGVTASGGVIPHKHDFQHELRGLYHAPTRSHRIVIHGRPIDDLELLEAVMFQRDNVNHADKPIDGVIYVFMTEAEAREHLDRLWYRGLGCVALIDGKEVRLDLGYRPEPPARPEWVARIEAETTGPNVFNGT